MRARGLKLCLTYVIPVCGVSRPMRARGLKLRLIVLIMFQMSRAPCGRVG